MYIGRGTYSEDNCAGGKKTDRRQILHHIKGWGGIDDFVRQRRQRKQEERIAVVRGMRDILAGNAAGSRILRRGMNAPLFIRRTSERLSIHARERVCRRFQKLNITPNARRVARDVGPHYTRHQVSGPAQGPGPVQMLLQNGG